MARQLKGIKDKEVAQIIKNLGRNIKTAREAQKLTQQELASRAGVAISTIWELENECLEDFRFSTVSAVANSLDMEILKLLS